MDTQNEDKIVRQIEKNLSNNINDNLFLTGRIYENNQPMTRDGKTPAILDENRENKDKEDKENKETNQDYPLVSYDYISSSPATMSRAEYIRQAREACLRQLSDQQIYTRPYDINYMEPVPDNSEQINHKKAKAWSLFHDETFSSAQHREEESPQEIAAFHSLIIRTVFAIVLFLSIFVIDKFEFKIGKVTTQVIEEYVTGKDSLQNLEDIIVTWLK